MSAQHQWDYGVLPIGSALLARLSDKSSSATITKHGIFDSRLLRHKQGRVKLTQRWRPGPEVQGAADMQVFMIIPL